MIHTYFGVKTMSSQLIMYSVMNRNWGKNCNIFCKVIFFIFGSGDDEIDLKLQNILQVSSQ